MEVLVQQGKVLYVGSSNFSESVLEFKF
jgi:diketogulonate reductase-like aldo/keto reductase